MKNDDPDRSKNLALASRKFRATGVTKHRTPPTLFRVIRDVFPEENSMAAGSFPG
jgi:hypothetical protein